MNGTSSYCEWHPEQAYILGCGNSNNVVSVYDFSKSKMRWRYFSTLFPCTHIAWRPNTHNEILLSSSLSRDSTPFISLYNIQLPRIPILEFDSVGSGKSQPISQTVWDASGNFFYTCGKDGSVAAISILDSRCNTAYLTTSSVAVSPTHNSFVSCVNLLPRILPNKLVLNYQNSYTNPTTDHVSTNSSVIEYCDTCNNTHTVDAISCISGDEAANVHTNQALTPPFPYVENSASSAGDRASTLEARIATYAPKVMTYNTLYTRTSSTRAAIVDSDTVRTSNLYSLFGPTNYKSATADTFAPSSVSTLAAATASESISVAASASMSNQRCITQPLSDAQPLNS
uniref:Protein transport protein sec-31 n=1 Tax=Lygus hesperus TaxID=30085 RepID=A0A0A9XGN4_LYGHE